MVRFSAWGAAGCAGVGLGAMVSAGAWGQTPPNNTQSSTNMTISPLLNQSQTQSQSQGASEFMTTGLGYAVPPVTEPRTAAATPGDVEKSSLGWAPVDAGHGFGGMALARNDEIGAASGRWRMGKRGAWSRCALYLFGDQTGAVQRAAVGRSCPAGLGEVAGWELISGEIRLFTVAGATAARLRPTDPDRWQGARTMDGAAVDIIR